MKTTVNEIINDKLGERVSVVCHSSGLTMYLIPKERVSGYCLISAPCGGRNTVSEKGKYPLGMAHFLEHKLFANEDGEDTCEKLGRLGAQANAYTGYLSTAYLFSATENIEDSVYELVKSFFSPCFTDENVESEKSIISEEIRMYDDDPSEDIFFVLARGVFKNPAFHFSPCGDIPSIKKTNVETLMRFYSEYYTPRKTILVLCGRFDRDKVISAADKALEGLKFDESGGKEIAFPEPCGAICERITVKRDIPIPMFRIGVKFKRPFKSGRDAVKFDLIISMIGDQYLSEENEFINGFYERGDISRPISFSWDNFDDENGMFILAGKTENIHPIARKIKKYILEIPKNPITEERLSTLKKIMLSDYFKSFDSCESFASEYLSYRQSDFNMFDYPELLSEITLEDFHKVSSEIFKKENVCTAKAMPKKEKDTAKE